MISFSDFFTAARGPAPYPWQERLASRCLESGPPLMVCAPTGTGKTAVVDALVWALAAQARRPASDRTVGVRTIWAIDRRILVDEVYEHAQRLASLLEDALDDPGHACHEPALALAELSGDRPLVATRWRGGIRETEELLGPTQPQIVTSTVAQVGSRLLFRGYGIGRGSLALQAGLTACDTTICLDEAHLAEPFAQTAAAIRRHRELTEPASMLPGLNAMTLTATPAEPAHDAIELSGEDEAVLGRRITGEKWAILDDTAETDRERANKLAEATAAYVDQGLPTVACVVNTVKQARAVFSRLEKRFTDEDVTLTLLIGPQRPADREQLRRGALRPLFEGTTTTPPVVCVATQTFEVGLDVDVVGMVSESASASAIVQRLGRLNRSGAAVGQATIIRDRDSWLYGEDEELAWGWLSSQAAEGPIDVSVISLDRDEARPKPLATPAAPTLTIDVINQLVQTNPPPGVFQDPDVEPFLRGAESESPVDVSVIWRCDLRPEATEPEADEYRAMLLDLAPPHPQEMLTLSIRSARALLAALYPVARTRRAAALSSALVDSDIEGATPPTAPPPAGTEPSGLPFLVLREGELHKGSLQSDGDAISPTALQPGDVIVLPTSVGGVDEHGLSIDASSKATDVGADIRPPTSKGQEAAVPFTVRISPEALSAKMDRALKRKEWRRIASQAGSASSLIAALDSVLPDDPILTSLLNPPAGIAWEIRPVDTTPLEDLGADNDEEGDEAPSPAASGDEAPAPPDGPTWVLIPINSGRRDQGDRRDDTNPPPSLSAHAQAVRDRTHEYATKLKLPPQVAGALDLAARAHDHGKADPRIQAFFRGGVAPVGEEAIAKSVFGTRNPRMSRVAARISGLPSGLHHEIASAAILSQEFDRTPSASGAETDRDLALHLVATHHGRGRPIPSVPTGGGPPRTFSCNVAGVSGTARGDGTEDWMSGSDVQRFWDVIERYGAWGAAFLEAVLMLADRTISSEGR